MNGRCDANLTTPCRGGPSGSICWANDLQFAGSAPKTTQDLRLRAPISLVFRVKEPKKRPTRSNGLILPPVPRSGSNQRMPAAAKPTRILSSGFVKMKLKAITNKAEKKRACEAYLKQMEEQREIQKKSRSSIEDTDDIIRFLRAEIKHLTS